LTNLNLSCNLISNINSLSELAYLNCLDISDNKYLNLLPNWVVESHIGFFNISRQFLNKSALRIIALMERELQKHNKLIEGLESIEKYGYDDNPHYDSGNGYNDNLDPDQQSIDYWEQF